MRFPFVLFLSCFLFYTSAAEGQTPNFQDGFEDGDFTSNPVWSGGTTDFSVISGNPNFLLQLDTGGADTSYLSTPSEEIDGFWEFYIEFRGFEPSGSNQAEIFLMSNIADLKGSVDGYAVQVGESGDDVFRLVRYDNGTEAATVVSDTTIVQSGGDYTVRVTRNSGGRWKLEVGKGYGGPLFDSGNTGSDDTHTASSYLGPKVSFTTSRADRFFFDFKIDVPPLAISEIKTNDNRVDVDFSRSYDKATVQPGDFSIDNGVGTPASVKFPSSTVVQLTYTSPLPSGEYRLTAQNIQDQNGKNLREGTSATFLVFANFEEGDIIINEFLYDPPGEQAEYVELKNRSEKFLNLQNWQIRDNANTGLISSDSLILRPNGYLVISSDTTALYKVHGKKPYIQMDNLPALNNGGDIVQVLANDNSKVDSLEYTPAWGGTNVALERRTDTVSSIFMENFGDSPNPLGGTPGSANEVADDTTPPDLDNLIITDNQTIDLDFSERLKNTVVENIGNYSLDNAISITKAVQIFADSVRLQLSSSLENGTAYQLTIYNQQDIFGNMAVPIDTLFAYYEITPADSGDIFLNEFSYDPPAGSTEYIELINLTSKSFDLSGWTLNDNTGNRQVIADARTVVPPESYVVIAPDKTLLNRFPDINLITMGSKFPPLNNSGDNIVLQNKKGQVLDSLQYTSTWGGEAVSLERRSTTVGPYQANFGIAPNGFGTPGATNEIQPDNKPPVLERLQIMDNTTIELTFSEAVTGKTATDKTNYSFSPHRGIQLISAVQDSVTLFLSEPLQSGQTHELSVQGLSDIFGNRMAKTTRKLTFVRFSSAKPGDISINEILFTRKNAADHEFVELFNTTDQNFDLSGWTIGDARQTTAIDNGTQLLAGDYLVLTGAPSLASKLDNGVFVSNFPALNNDEDAVYIRNENGVTIDSLFYTRVFGNIEGKSIERKDPRAASNDPANYATSTAASGSTPGKRNSVFEPDEVSPALTFAHIFSNGNIQVRFSEFVILNSDLTFSIDGQPLTVNLFNPDNGDRISLNTPAGIEPGNAQTLVAQNLTDVKGNTTSSAQIPIAQPLNPGDVVINEILYNPINKTDDNQPDQSEYIELRNTKDYAISLEGITLHDAADENGDVRTLIPESTDLKYIPEGGTALVYPDEEPHFNKSRVAKFFNLPDPPAHTLIRVERSTLSLASADDAIFLAGRNGVEIDSVFYDESWQNPNLVDTDGVALERINPEGPSSDASNWGSSINRYGGTPNEENTIFQEPGAPTRDENGISFSPNPFSPDGDGSDDRLFINYKLGQSDYLITVRIYDRYGRRVRELADGKPAGFQGSLIWDGRKDNGDRNRIGIYIIIFKAFDSANGETRAFKKTVVLARRLN